MLNKTDLLKALHKECDICIHLYGKIPEGGLDYRPSHKQRNTLELLKYLSFCGIAFAEGMTGNWDVYNELEQQSETMPSEEFPVAMERQKVMLTELFDLITDDDFATKESVLPSGERTKLGYALLDMPFRCMCGYRMQLFLYAKAAGNDALITPNCWFGVDVETMNENN
jgi:hypothetical protein